MTDTVNRYATLKTGSNVVENIIVAPTSFTLDGYTLNLLLSDVFCSPGMYYNSTDNLYYQDAAFTTVYPVAETDDQTADEITDTTDTTDGTTATS